MYKSQKKIFNEFLADLEFDLSKGYHQILKDIATDTFKYNFIEKLMGKVVSYDKHPEQIHIEYRYKKNYVQVFFSEEEINIVVNEDDENAIVIKYSNDAGNLCEKNELYNLILQSVERINSAF